MKLCESVGCEMSGNDVGKCIECKDPVFRCESCRIRFEKVMYCTSCTGGSGIKTAPLGRPTHPDQERDEDANGGLSNARRALEETE